MTLNTLICLNLKVLVLTVYISSLENVCSVLLFFNWGFCILMFLIVFHLIICIISLESEL